MLNFNGYKSIGKSKINKVISFLTETVKTIMNEDIPEEEFVSQNSLFDTTLSVKLKGNGVERSYEDRSVYFNLIFTDQTESKGNYVQKEKVDLTTWINGEDAVKLGQMLIKHGLYSLESNMVNHQKMHHYSQLERFLREERIEKVIITKTSDDVEGYGSGFMVFDIKPIWKEGKAPEYQKDFEFNDVIYFSPFEKEFKDQLKEYGGIKNVEFVNYSREEEEKKFQEFAKQYESVYDAYINKLKRV